LISRIESCEFEIYYKERHKCLLIERGATVHLKNRIIHKGAASTPWKKVRIEWFLERLGL